MTIDELRSKVFALEAQARALTEEIVALCKTVEDHAKFRDPLVALVASARRALIVDRLGGGGVLYNDRDYFRRTFRQAEKLKFAGTCEEWERLIGSGYTHFAPVVQPSAFLDERGNPLPSRQKR